MLCWLKASSYLPTAFIPMLGKIKSTLPRFQNFFDDIFFLAKCLQNLQAFWIQVGLSSPCHVANGTLVHCCMEATWYAGAAMCMVSWALEALNLLEQQQVRWETVCILWIWAQVVG